MNNKSINEIFETLNQFDLDEAIVKSTSDPTLKCGDTISFQGKFDSQPIEAIVDSIDGDWIECTMTTGSRRGQSKTLYRNRAKLGKIKNMLGINEAVDIVTDTVNPDFSPYKYNSALKDINQMSDTDYYRGLMDKRNQLLRSINCMAYGKSPEKEKALKELDEINRKLRLIADVMTDEERDAWKKYGNKNITKNVGVQYQLDDYDEEGNPVEDPKITGTVRLDSHPTATNSHPLAAGDGSEFLAKEDELATSEETNLKDAEVSMKQYQDEKEKEAKKKAKEVAKFNNGRNLFNADSKKFEALEDDYLNQDFEDPEEDEEN